MSLFSIFSSDSSRIAKIANKFSEKLSSCNTWNKLMNVLAEYETELEKLNDIKHANKYFAEKMDSNKAGVIQKLYYKDGDKFYEITSECEIDFDILPNELKTRLVNLNEEIDISEIVEKELNIRSIFSGNSDGSFKEVNKPSAVDEIISTYNNKLTLCSNWNNFVSLMYDLYGELSKFKFSRKFFAKVTNDKRVNISMKLYIKSDGKFYEFTSNSKIAYDDLPANVQREIKNFSDEFDISEAVEKILIK